MGIDKNRSRNLPTFANINLLGKCNADCFFCLGKDISWSEEHGSLISSHFSEWPHFQEFLVRCKHYAIVLMYVTGQTADPLQYAFLEPLIRSLQNVHGFRVGLRTNGIAWHPGCSSIMECRRRIGYTINTLCPDRQEMICGVRNLPDWSRILDESPPCRVSVVVCTHNHDEIEDIISFCSTYRSVQYVQLRRISTDHRTEELKDHARSHDELSERLLNKYGEHGKLWGNSEVMTINGLQVVLWRTTQTTISSINYFIDGTISDNYFIVEGYERERDNHDRR